MKFTTRVIYSLLLLILIWNQDTFITAHSLQVQKAEFLRRHEASASKFSVKTHKSSKMAVTSHTHSKPSSQHRFLKTHKEKNRLFFLIFAIVMLTLIVVAVVAKKIIEHYIDKEMKFLSDEVNKQKVQVMHKRLEENKDYIDFCLSYQKVARMYKSYSILAQISKSEFHDSMKALRRDLSFSPTKDHVLFYSLAEIKGSDIDEFYKKSTEELNFALNKNCFNAYQRRAGFTGVNLGDGYKGFSEEEFATIDNAMSANKKAMHEYAGAEAIDYVQFGGEQLNENKYGTDQFSTIESMKDPTQKSSKFKVFDMSTEKLSKAGFVVAGAGVATAGLNIGFKIKELTDLMKEPIDDQFLRVFKYIMIAMEIMDNLIQGSAGVALLLKNANIDFPFITVVVALGNFVVAIKAFTDAKNNAEEQKSPDYELERDLKFWDAFDSGFSLMQAIVDCVLKLVTLTSAGITAGVSTAIGLAVKALVSISSLFFAGMKLKKIRDIKDKLVAYMSKKTAEFSDEVEKNRNNLVKERCA